MNLIPLRFPGHSSDLPADKEERGAGGPEDGPGEGQRPSAGPGQRVREHAERRLLCSQNQRGKDGCCGEDYIPVFIWNKTSSWHIARRTCVTACFFT